MSTAAHRSIFVRSVVSVLSHRVISRARSVVRGHPTVWSLGPCLDDVTYLLSVHFNIVHQNRKRSLQAQSRVREEFLEEKYQVFAIERPLLYSSPSAPFTTQYVWKSVQVSSVEAFRLWIVRTGSLVSLICGA